MAYENHRTWWGGIALVAMMSAAAAAAGQAPGPTAPPAPKAGTAGEPGQCCGRRAMHHRGFQRGFGLGYALRELDLSDAQRDQVHAVMERHQGEFSAAADKTKEARRALAAASRSGSADENAIRAAASSLGDAEGNLAVLRARVKGEVWDILTPEQRQKAEALEQQREQRFEQRWQRRQRPQG